MGINSIKAVVKKLAEKAGLHGKYTNHSLRATAAIRLFEAGVNEQVIKSVTGHRSDAVRDYKRLNPKIVSEAQKKVSCTVSKAPEDLPEMVKPELPELKRKSPFEFDIDEYEIGDIPKKEFVNTNCLGNRCHKHNMCAEESSQCNEMCKVMKKLDSLSEKNRIKKLKLSLKYRSHKN